MRRLAVIPFAAMSLSTFGCSYFPESSFELAHESRLPKWFTLRSGLTRPDVTVTMDYYIDSGGRTATFKLLDVRKQPPWPEGRPSGRRLADVNGTNKGSEPLTLKNNPRPISGQIPYPSYEIITANGITEVIEHRKMEPIFYIVDDPAVLSELGVH
jgi:hypothetical protein